MPLFSNVTLLSMLLLVGITGVKEGSVVGRLALMIFDDIHSVDIAVSRRCQRAFLMISSHKGPAAGFKLFAMTVTEHHRKADGCQTTKSIQVPKMHLKPQPRPLSRPPHQTSKRIPAVRGLYAFTQIPKVANAGSLLTAVRPPTTSKKTMVPGSSFSDLVDSIIGKVRNVDHAIAAATPYSCMPVRALRGEGHDSIATVVGCAPFDVVCWRKEIRAKRIDKDIDEWDVLRGSRYQSATFLSGGSVTISPSIWHGRVGKPLINWGRRSRTYLLGSSEVGTVLHRLPVEVIPDDAA
ncbi:hypothetical protein EV401DRAFT_1887027 [Pisolithus croceorrhizus]|nr:hypothetical protein EV401DRAFT_1887027 [Pisolithus croceorrhizus]